MTTQPMKALEVEALTFIYPAAPSKTAAGERPTVRLWRPRPATVGLAVAIVVLAALAWVLFPA
jgi:hypothetical protein